MKSNRTSETLDEIIHNALNKQVEAWTSQGISASEISERIDNINVTEMAGELVHTVSGDYLEFYKSHMDEIERDEMKEEEEFVRRQIQKWGKCFVASRTMYVIAVEAAESYSEVISKKDTSEMSGKEYTYASLQHIHGRACQEFLEIYHLLRLGFADGAYARWRSMYELCCYGQFIVTYGEQIAKQYYEQSDTENRSFDWTNGALSTDGRKLRIVNFDKLQDSINVDQTWKEQYRLACLVNHGSPQGTFKRLANYGKKRIIPVGHSDYGIAMPAVNSAVTLAWMSNLFLGIIPTYESLAKIQLLNDWATMLRTLYIETEGCLFPDSNKE